MSVRVGPIDLPQSTDRPHHDPALSRAYIYIHAALHYDASEQGDCLLARLSLDSALLAIQRSRHVVEVRQEGRGLDGVDGGVCGLDRLDLLM